MGHTRTGIRILFASVIGLTFPVMLFGVQETVQSGGLRSTGQHAYEKGDYAEAERYYRDALKTADTKGASAEERARASGDLAAVLSEAGRFKESEELLTHGLNLIQGERVSPQVHAILLSNLAGIYLGRDQFVRAEVLLNEAAALLLKTTLEGSSLVAVLKNLGIVYAETGPRIPLIFEA
jgi:tetratricopeptide (TPR) repeat protein